MRPSVFFKLFYLRQFLHDFILIYAVDKLFFIQSGVTVAQIAVLLAIWAAASFCLEIPTGILADHWDRRRMLILSGLLYAVCYTIWIFSPDFTGFLVGFIFRSLASTFSNGTIQAYLYDFLAVHSAESRFEKIWGRGRAFNLAGISLAWVCGGLVSEHSYFGVLIASAAAGIAVSAVTLFFPVVEKHARTEEPKPFSFFGKSMSYAWKQPVLLNAFLYTAVVRSSYGVLDEYWPVYFQWLGVSNARFGMLVAAATLAGGLVGVLAHRFKNYSWRVINCLVIYMSVVLIAAGLFKSYIAALLLLSLEMAMSISGVLVEGAIQASVPGHHRATIASANSMLRETCIVTGLVFGYIADRFGIRFGYVFFGIFILLYFAGRPFITSQANKHSRSA